MQKHTFFLHDLKKQQNGSLIFCLKVSFIQQWEVSMDCFSV